MLLNSRVNRPCYKIALSVVVLAASLLSTVCLATNPPSWGTQASTWGGSSNTSPNSINPLINPSTNNQACTTSATIYFQGTGLNNNGNTMGNWATTELVSPQPIGVGPPSLIGVYGQSTAQPAITTLPLCPGTYLFEMYYYLAGTENCGGETCGGTMFVTTTSPSGVLTEFQSASVGLWKAQPYSACQPQAPIIAMYSTSAGPLNLPFISSNGWGDWVDNCPNGSGGLGSGCQDQTGFDGIYDNPGDPCLSVIQLTQTSATP